LEKATHPLIRREMDRFLKERRRGVAVVDVPLLFEARMASCFDATVLVSAPASSQVARVMSRDGLPRAEALRRLRAQWPMARKERLADVVIPNTGTLAQLRRAVSSYQRAFALLSAGAAAAASNPAPRSGRARRPQ
ncbi:MAG TPA: dephospho-CoA kinase, partial [Elusimicrobiota bacterium]|nr:dephospho-CoA kinase [Elusimicrobiota bacterium]